MPTFPRRARAILNRFTVPETALLGAGSESHVFAIDATQVLRIYSPKVTWEYVNARHALLDRIRQAGWPATLALPEIYATGAWADQVYTVERRMPGRDFAAVLPTLYGEARAKALASFVEAAAQIGRVDFTGEPFGELMTSDSAIRRTRWTDYLWERLLASLAGSRDALARDLPAVDAVLAHTQRALAHLEPVTAARLVHGDFFAGNVFINDDLNLCGVGDFGYSTLVGDPRMDLAATLVFWDVSPATVPPAQAAEDAVLLLDLLRPRLGSATDAVVEAYRLYYSFYFSGCGDDDPTTYAWCVGNLRRAAASL